jgi:chromosomal replication initiator protein
MQPGCQALVSPHSVQDESVRRIFARLIGQQQYDHWFRDKTELSLAEDELVVRAASPFLLKWLQKQFKESLLLAAVEALGPAARLRFDSAVIASAGAAPSRGGSADLIAIPVETAELSIIATCPPQPVVTVPQRSERPAGRRFAELADFIVGPCNELPLTAVRQVCSRPDGAGGPLFLYGPVGTGKTHLLEGVYRTLRRGQSDLQTLFLTSEQFTNYFTQAFRDRTLPAFRQKFRSVDVLLVDDVDFFEGKKAVQEEFLHTYKQLDSLGKLIVASADRHPRQLTRLSDELRTRFLSGMVCRLEAPDIETRERIVIRKAEKLDGDFSPEALRYVAQRFSGSVRELEGALHCLQVYGRMTGKRVGVTAARQALADLERDCLRVVRLADIERVVCHLFGLEAEELRSAGRTRTVCEPRMVAMYLARRHTRSAYSEIGRHFGGRNHATVIAAERKVAGWIREGVSVRVASRTWRLGDILETLEQQLQAG